MKRSQSRRVIGTAIGAAAIAVAIDHTRQRLPEPQVADQQAVIILEEGEELPATDAPECGKGARPARQPSPCSL